MSTSLCNNTYLLHKYKFAETFDPPLQAMANDFDLNIGNNIRMRDTQFMSMFWPKTLENWVKCILPCVHLGHTGGINLYFDTKHDLKDRKKRNNVFVRCFGTND